MNEVVSHYFELDAERDIEGMLALFSTDAAVTDEGETHHGQAQIRAWQLGPASKYVYTTEVTTIDTTGPGRFLATGRLTGNFPGGTADLHWDFTIVDDRITRLVIAP